MCYSPFWKEAESRWYYRWNTKNSHVRGLEDCDAFVGDFKVHLPPRFARFLHEAFWNQTSTPVLQAVSSLCTLVLHIYIFGYVTKPQIQFCLNPPKIWQVIHGLAFKMYVNNDVNKTSSLFAWFNTYLITQLHAREGNHTWRNKITASR